MALQLSHRICVECNVIQFIDDTGAYDAVTNPNGWGTPNPPFGTLTPYTVAITIPNQTVPILTIDLLDDPPAANSDGEYVWEIAAGDLGLEFILSGDYTFHIIAGDTGNVNGGVPITNTLYPTLTGDIEKKVMLKVNELQKCGAMKDKRTAWDLYDRLRAAIIGTCCGDTTVQSQINQLYLDVAACGC